MTEYVTTNMRLPKEICRKLKQRALDAETSLAEVVRESVNRYLSASTDASAASLVTQPNSAIISAHKDAGADSHTLRESPIASYAATIEGGGQHILINPQLYDRVEQASNEHRIGIDRLLTEAIRRYLWELDRRKISEESQIYRQHHADLKTRYLGQFVAMYDGQVVDHDKEIVALRQRVRQRFGWKPVLIMLVEEDVERVFVRHGFRLETVEP